MKPFDLKAAAEMALEALEDTLALCINYKSVEDADGYVFTEASDVIKQGESAHKALRQALDQLPDTTKMIDTGTDRGAWSDVPDATKWVDELRGDDEEWTPEYTAYRPGGLSVEEPPNSTKPVGEIVEAHGLIGVSIPEMPPVGTKLYTAPQPAKPAQQQEPVAWLSRDDARLALWDAINKREFGNPTDDKFILDHLRKNGLWIGKYTSPPPKQPEQEPVAWIRKNGFRFNENLEPKDGSEIPLYAAPPKREWVGLTDEEMYKLWLCADEDNDRMSFGKAVEAKLREKNHG